MTKLQDTSTTKTSGWPSFPDMQAEFAQMLDRFAGLRPEFGGRLTPALDMSETDEHVEITAEVPGLKADDIEATLVQDRLVLKGEHKDEREESGKDWHMVERRTGSFRRVIPLGFTPGDDDMEAKLADGILHLKITKPTELRETSKKIRIDTA